MPLAADPDVVLVTQSGAVWLENGATPWLVDSALNGTNTAAPITTAGSPTAIHTISTPSGVLDAVAADYDADGRVDIGLCLPTGGLAWLRNTGAVPGGLRFSSMVSVPGAGGCTAIITALIDGDVYPDLVVSSNTSVAWLRAAVGEMTVASDGNDAHCRQDISAPSTAPFHRPCRTLQGAVVALQSFWALPPFSLAVVRVHGSVALDAVALGTLVMARPIVFAGTPGTNATLQCTQSSSPSFSDSPAVQVCGSAPLTLRNLAVTDCMHGVLQAMAATVHMEGVVVAGLAW